MKIKFLFLLIILMGLNGCDKNRLKSSFASENSSSDKSVKETKANSETKLSSGTGTLVIKPIKFNKEAYVRDAVKNECNLDGKLAQFIEQNATDQYAKIMTDSSSKSSKAQILTITIEQVNGGRGRGGWGRSSIWAGGRGGNMVGVKGKLTQGGKVLGDFKALRVTSGGAFAGFKGACAMLGRCVKTLGSDIAGWLTDPARNSTLGDF